MQQCRADQPRHKGGVLDRVPEPPAAPAQRVIGPPAAHRDAGRQRAPRRQGPGPHPARPGRVDPTFEQRCDRKAEGDRKPDIAEIEAGRVKGEARVAQYRVEAHAVRRRRPQPQKRVRGEQDKQQKPDADHRLHGKNPRPQRRRQIPPEQRDRRAEQRQDEHPEEHRALVVAPDARQFVEERLCAVGIGRDIGQREIRHRIGVHQRDKRDRDKQELREYRRPRPGDQRAVAARRAVQRQAGLQHGDAQRQHQRKMADLGDHHAIITPPPRRHRPCLNLRHHHAAESEAVGWAERSEAHHPAASHT